MQIELPAKTGIQAVLYRMLTDIKYRPLRHITLISMMFVIALNYAGPYDHSEVFSTPIFTCYTISILLTYMVSAYFNLYVLMPRYLLTKRYGMYVLILSLLIGLILFIQYTLEDIVYSLMGLIPIPTYDFNNNMMLILDFLGGYFLNFIAFSGSAVTLFLRYFATDNQRAGELEKKQLHAEVDHLKQQVPPGFLFNTLHHIAEVGETNTVAASAALMQFSKMLRYQLYDSNRKRVFLSSEIQILHDYLQLEHLSYGHLTFEISTEGELSYILIPPLLFIPLVRELVDSISTPQTHANLSICFFIDGEQLIFTCSGDIRINIHSTAFNTIRQRLQLLFDNRYSLETLPPPFIIPDGHKLRLIIPTRQTEGLL